MNILKTHKNVLTSVLFNITMNDNCQRKGLLCQHPNGNTKLIIEKLSKKIKLELIAAFEELVVVMLSFDDYYLLITIQFNNYDYR